MCGKLSSSTEGLGWAGFEPAERPESVSEVHRPRAATTRSISNIRGATKVRTFAVHTDSSSRAWLDVFRFRSSDVPASLRVSGLLFCHPGTSSVTIVSISTGDTISPVLSWGVPSCSSGTARYAAASLRLWRLLSSQLATATSILGAKCGS